MRQSELILSKIKELDTGEVNIMEVCGTHTHSIARAGIKQMLPENIHLLSGPGCPVCVTPSAAVDEILRLSEREDVIIATYGDMLKVPGSKRGDTLALRKAQGARVEIVFSPVDAVMMAKNDPVHQIVFLGVGFETTAPGTAASVALASSMGLTNYSVFTLLKTVEPALFALRNDPDFNVSGFLCPGHVATIIGEDGFRFLSEKLMIPGVISGFEPEDILLSVYMLLRQIKEGRHEVENEYRRAVSKHGNPLALETISKYLTPSDEIWRGLGLILSGGLSLKDEFSSFDAGKRFGLVVLESKDPAGCCCGDVICGKIHPSQCPLFGKVCVPEDAVGPCMVSGEGACAAAYKYGEY